VDKNTGFTLIEVLIAMLVLAGGLLGLAGLQATSLSNGQSAYNRSQATQLAYQLADNMRANIPGVAAYTGSATQIANCLTTVGCIPSQMAQNDLYQWNLAVTTALPGGVGTIAVTAGVYTITISWTDKNNNGVPVSTSFTTSFRLS